MKKKTGAFNTILILSYEEAEGLCGLGKGEKRCPFLVNSSGTWECYKMNYPGNGPILQKIKEGTMKAKGDSCKDCNWDFLRDKAEEL